MKKYIFSLFAGVLLSSCANQLEVTPPNQIIDEQIKEILASGDEEKIKLVMKALAENLPTNLISNSSVYSGGFASSIENHNVGQDILRNVRGNDIVYTDKLMSGSVGNAYNLQDFWEANLTTENYCYWLLGATVINNANKILGYLDEKTIGDNNTLKDYRARCLIVRAYGYNYLMENYQDAYLLGGSEKLGLSIYDTYGYNDPVARSTSKETYEFIKKDLNEAITLFKQAVANDGYTDAKDDLDCGIAQFLLARVSAWTGDWATVITACDDLLKHYPDLIAKENYGVQNAVVREVEERNVDGTPVREFRADDNAFFNITVNPECFFGFVDGTNAQTYQFAYFNTFCESSGGMGLGFMRIDERLYNKLDNNDLRKGLFMTDTLTFTYMDEKATKATIPAYTNLKYAATIARNNSERKTGRVNTDQPVFRTSEVLLMKAEALAQQNNESAAKTVLNQLLAARTKSNSTPLTCDTYSSMEGMSVLQMVQFQTRIELWGEGGREFYNNKRWAIPVDRSNSANHVNTGSISVEHMTLEIPSQELSTNPLCVQN